MAAPDLLGWTVGVTADRRAEEQIELLRRRGANVVHGPTIRTHPLREDEGVIDATIALIRETPDVVVLSTGVGVRAWVNVADAAGLGTSLIDVLRSARVLARGPKAAGAASSFDVPVHHQAPGATSEELLDLLERDGVRGARVAVQLDGGSRVHLAQRLRRLGADVVTVPVYRWTQPIDHGPAARLMAAAAAGRIDALTFTSAPALENAMGLAPTPPADTVVVASIGPVCTAAARRAGLAVAVEPERSRLGAMVLALAHHAREIDARQNVHVAGRRVILRAGAVVVDGNKLDLSDRERDYLAALLDRPGAVVSKESLLARVWGADERQQHAVEAGIARLRRRLGDCLTIATVPRRGYRLAT